MTLALCSSLLVVSLSRARSVDARHDPVPVPGTSDRQESCADGNCGELRMVCGRCRPTPPPGIALFTSLSLGRRAGSDPVLRRRG